MWVKGKRINLKNIRDTIQKDTIHCPMVFGLPNFVMSKYRLPNFVMGK